MKRPKRARMKLKKFMMLLKRLMEKCLVVIVELTLTSRNWRERSVVEREGRLEWMRSAVMRGRGLTPIGARSKTYAAFAYSPES